ncbi:MAG: TPM domain-containing protein [Bacteroidales bacterium]|nr:TPM domain-containing protein [Bacteroidales bacterium]
MHLTSKFFTEEQKALIAEAIARAERETSGEIRLHIDSHCKGDVLDNAAYIFAKLKMHKTKLRNGVLFYLAVNNKKFAILGDAGINAVVPKNFWNDVKDKVISNFKEEKYTEGLIAGIEMAGYKLKEFFPYKEGEDKNELSDDISFN